MAECGGSADQLEFCQPHNNSREDYWRSKDPVQPITISWKSKANSLKPVCTGTASSNRMRSIIQHQATHSQVAFLADPNKTSYTDIRYTKEVRDFDILPGTERPSTQQNKNHRR